MPYSINHARWMGMSVLAVCLTAFAPGCGGGDGTSSDAPAGQAGQGGNGGSAGNPGDAAIDQGAAGTQDSGKAGSGGQDSGIDSATKDTGTSDTGNADAKDTGTSDTGAIDAAPDSQGCKDDTSCAGNATGSYCNVITGACVQCKVSDLASCTNGNYCDPSSFTCLTGCDSADDCPSADGGTGVCNPVTHACVDCNSDTQCPLGFLCKTNICEPGCNALHGCQNGTTCCNSKCVNTNSDPANCSACGKACSAPNATAGCQNAKCTVDFCDNGFEDCDKIVSSGCEAPTGDASSACLCNPGEKLSCYDGPVSTKDVGACKGGEKTCNADGLAWGFCIGEILPVAETCYTAADDNCNGETNESGQGCVCTPDAVEPCYTGDPNTRNVGTCTDGTWKCNAAGTARSTCQGQVLPTPETCLTPVDDDCDGMVNESGSAGCSCIAKSTQACYGGPPGTAGVGTCKSGTQTCDDLGGGYGPCTGDVLPSADICSDSLDNDCNGVVNDGITGGAAACVCFPGAVSNCYGGAAGTLNVGVCKAGVATCNTQGSAWGTCTGEVKPSTDNCTDSLDNDCNGTVNDGYGKGGTGCVCAPASTQTCYTGPAGTQGVGACSAGSSACAIDGKTWGSCIGQVIPDLDSCLDGIDNDCNGVVNDGNHLAPGCACVPGSVKCVNAKESICNASGDWGTPAGLCNQICKAGQFSCSCNDVLQCDVSVPPAKWIAKTTCTATQTCDAVTGTCKAITVTGGTVPTGTYYQYGIFTSATGFKGGYDVDSYGDFVYVNRSALYLDIYKIVLADTDADGKMEPDQHPSNPFAIGPMEKRTLQFVQTLTKSAADPVPLASASNTELFAASDRIFSLGPTRNGDITEYIFATKATKKVVDSTVNFTLSLVGYGPSDSIWYGAVESPRRVYSFCESGKKWVPEFDYPNLTGGHMDGLEVITAPSTNVQYVYVSDMTSDFLAQYRRNGTGGWVQENLFKYTDSTSSSVEGMGFGALNHFWMTGGNTLIEIGGGDLGAYLQ